MRTIGEITLESAFGQALAEIAAGRSVLEIGTGSGIGSTRCLLSTCNLLMTVEGSREQYEHNKHRLGFRLREVRYCGAISKGIKPYWHPLNRIQDKETWQFERDLVATQPLSSIAGFDVLLLDGGEFTSDADFLTLWQVPEIIALDDTNPTKSVKNCYGRDCLIKAGWTVLHDHPEDRDGWFIAQK